MKKIVSTMFKCGAIFASLTTAFADEAVNEEGNATIKTPSSGEVFTYKGYLKDFLSTYELPLEEKCQSLYLIAEALRGIISEAKRLHKTPNWNLMPDHIRMFHCSKPYVLHFSFLDYSTSTECAYSPELFSENPTVAFACLMLYVTHPEIREFFEKQETLREEPGFIDKEYRMRIGKLGNRLEFQRWSFSRQKWVPMEGNFTEVKMATFFLNNEITLDQLMNYLESPETYNHLIKELKIMAEGTTSAERANALDRAIERYHFEKQVALVEIHAPDVLCTAMLIQALDLAQEDTFREDANNYRENAEKLAEVCSTQSVEKCKAQGKIQISERAMEILLKWYGVRSTPAA